MSYEEKYLKYKNKYIEEKYKIKVLNNIYNNFIHNNLEQKGGNTYTFRNTNLKSTLEYIFNHYEKMDSIKNTTKKYFVILYGPPASGKTLAKNIACHIIKKYMEEKISEKEILNTFVDSNIDNLTYDQEIKDEEEQKSNDIYITLQKKLLKELQKTKDTLGMKENEEVTPENIVNFNDFIKTYGGLYYINRTQTLSDLMIFLGSYLNRNIFFETASGNIGYPNILINILKWYNYIPIIVYPYIENIPDNITELYKRSIKRGNSEGRFLTYQDIETFKKNSDKNYFSLFHPTDELPATKEFINNKTFIICRYNAMSTHYNHYINFNFDNLNEDIYDLYIKKEYVEIEKKMKI